MAPRFDVVTSAALLAVHVAPIMLEPGTSSRVDMDDDRRAVVHASVHRRWMRRVPPKTQATATLMQARNSNQICSERGPHV